MKKAFTLIELLVVISIISLMMSIVLPSLNAARKLAKKSTCKSNVRQIAIANNLYTQDNGGYYILAASDMNKPSGNLKRWHGERITKDDPFDFRKSDLYGYLGEGGIKACPEKVEFASFEPWDYNFEQGGGGYGYNMAYIGSRTKEYQVRNPGQTIYFADAAMAKLDGAMHYYLEYSFVEPPFFVYGGVEQKGWGYASPSMHFRHKKEANIVWVDGHVGSAAMAPFDRSNAYGVKSSDMLLGWPTLDNSLFDLK